MQIKLVNVEFAENSKQYSFLYDNFKNLKIGDQVVVETSRGQELGTIRLFIEEEKIEDREYKSVVRLATEKDIITKGENKNKEKEITQKTAQLAKDLVLDMKVINSELSLDRTKVVINFTSEDRVDFRELVKQLASIYHIRIELRQIGLRDEVKIVGGLGPCGQPCCCKRFLDDFTHSSIKMAKNQNLSLNPTKISGLCGRLMCCLSYENDFYTEANKNMPKLNSAVITPNGEGTVIYNNLFENKVVVKFQNERLSEIREYDPNQIKLKKD